MTSSAARPAPDRAFRASSIDLSKRDLTLDLARVFCVALVVVIHLLMAGVGLAPDGALVVSKPLEEQPWFAGATWAGQIMPLFFVVGGFASLTAWRSLQRRDGTASDYVRNRVLRLAQPTLPLFVFFVVALGTATVIGVEPKLLNVVSTSAGLPLWFLAAYALCQAFVPTMAGWHARAPRATLLVLLAAVVAVDAARFLSGITEVGLANLFFVWLLVQQFGFWYADGWFAARNGWQLAGITLAAYGALAAVTLPEGWYSNDMLANLNPPTLPLVLLGIAQACILRALRPWLARLMTTTAARAFVLVIGTRLMTIYLWHLPLILALSGLALLVPGAAPLPATSVWWMTRPLLLVAVAVALWGLSYIVGRWEAPRQLGATPPAIVVGIAAALTFIPAFAVLQWFLDLPIAILGAVCLGVAVMLLGRGAAMPSEVR